MATRNAWVVGFLVMVAACLYASEGEVKPVPCLPGLAMDDHSLSAHDTQFFKPTEPKGLVSAHAVAAMVHGAPDSPFAELAEGRGQMLTIAVAIDSAKADAKAPDVARFDFTGKADFVGAPVAPLQARRDDDGDLFCTIGPATFDVKLNGKPVPVTVRGTYQRSTAYRWMTLDFGTAVEGRLAFGNKTYAVRVVDGDGDFAAGTKAKALRAAGFVAGVLPSDTLAIDAGNDGFGPKVLRAYYGQPVRVDGAWWDVELSADGAKITAKPSKAEAATLQIAQPRWEAKLAGEKYVLTLEGSAQPLAIPADRYTVIEFRQTAQADRPEDEAAWLTCGERDLWEGKGKVFDAAAGKTTTLPIGAPLTASIATQVKDSMVRMDFVLVDSAGLRAEVRLPETGAPAPEVEVFDAGGKPVYQGKFQFG